MCVIFPVVLWVFWYESLPYCTATETMPDFCIFLFLYYCMYTFTYGRTDERVPVEIVLALCVLKFFSFDFLPFINLTKCGHRLMAADYLGCRLQKFSALSA